MAQLIGERIKKRRLELGLSQKDLANIMGYGSRVSIANFESGDFDFKISTLRALAKALECEVSYLIGESEK